MKNVFLFGAVMVAGICAAEEQDVADGAYVGLGLQMERVSKDFEFSGVLNGHGPDLSHLSVDKKGRVYSPTVGIGYEKAFGAVFTAVDFRYSFSKRNDKYTSMIYFLPDDYFPFDISMNRGDDLNLGVRFGYVLPCSVVPYCIFGIHSRRYEYAVDARNVRQPEVLAHWNYKKRKYGLIYGFGVKKSLRDGWSVNCNLLFKENGKDVAQSVSGVDDFNSGRGKVNGFKVKHKTELCWEFALSKKFDWNSK